jgi:DNA-binding NtrC family response regulator
MPQTVSSSAGRQESARVTAPRSQEEIRPGAGLVPGFTVDTLGVGAMDRLATSFDAPRPDRLLHPVSSSRSLAAPILTARRRESEVGGTNEMIGASPAMAKVFRQIACAAPTEAAVLILGESGTGKELVAEAIHRQSGRSAREMIAINCGAIPANLFESELFGHERGSFTGADRIHRGHFERADGGTLFLDEICEMPRELQVKLLRVLESGTFTRVGGDRAMKVNVRIVAAAKSDLERAAAEGRFRADLLYRLKVIPILLPPLRERGGDLELLASHFLAVMNRAGETDKRLLPVALERLRAHDWPGNVRELKHALERAYILSEGAIDGEYLSDPEWKRVPSENAANLAPTALGIELGKSLVEVERQVILATLDFARGNKVRAAAILGISGKTLYSRLREYRSGSRIASEPEPDKLDASAQHV